MFLEVEMQQDRCRWYKYKLNCKKQQKQCILKETKNKEGTA